MQAPFKRQLITIHCCLLGFFGHQPILFAPAWLWHSHTATLADAACARLTAACTEVMDICHPATWDHYVTSTQTARETRRIKINKPSATSFNTYPSSATSTYYAAQAYIARSIRRLGCSSTISCI